MPPRYLTDYTHPSMPLGAREPSRDGAYAKCLPGQGAVNGIGCGATLMSHLDWQLHWCDPFETLRRALAGDRDEHAVRM